MSDGTLSLHVDGRQVATERMATDPDPWLVLRTSKEHYFGSLRNLRVEGAPKVPSEIRLTGDRPLHGWHADYYHESFHVDGPRSPGDDGESEEPAWFRQGEEIRGSLVPFAAGSHLESLLQYHRPLVEDGMLEYISITTRVKSNATRPSTGRCFWSSPRASRSTS